MAALVTSIVITALMIAGVIEYGKRRPVDRQTSWGEAMLGSAFVFMLLLMVFGVVPDRWVRLTDNEWGWSVERMLFTEGQFIDGNPITFPPMRMDLKKVSDVVVVIQHIVALVGLPLLWLWWQKRDQKKVVAEPVSDFGRPLVKGS
ncbi:MAG TPA: hypothetical protein DCP89_05470 [Acidimicrobiaceae bacterium]|nr:hypothetical protein [Actinomycetota bacterium]MDG1489874.1 hypothetical protein [Actinomycetota bacterium]MDG2119573.1 hypothetical protein [Actinomycetota bacterium]NCG39646.1 hypothetical protein [Actinomycetota bacterium]HAN07931.1 hypothetical protein [Acidimicrobiaceae bacterium]